MLAQFRYTSHGREKVRRGGGDYVWSENLFQCPKNEKLSNDSTRNLKATRHHFHIVNRYFYWCLLKL